MKSKCMLRFCLCILVCCLVTLNSENAFSTNCNQDPPTGCGSNYHGSSSSCGNSCNYPNTCSLSNCYDDLGNRCYVCSSNINGACGSANGQSYTSAPGSNLLCSAGTASPASLSGSGPWTWQCTGSGTGTTASCSANVLVVNGSCGSANGISSASAPSSNLCNAGTSTLVSGSGPWTWQCTGSGTGTTASCSAPVLLTGSNYCNIPSSLATVVPPNILFVIDVSGSMTETAPTDGITYSSSNSYEGYFTPTANYSFNSSGQYWQQTSSTAVSCPTSSGNISTSSVYSGSCLNYWLMSKIDMVRWAVTGGAPETCTGSNIFKDGSCDVGLYSASGTNKVSTTACNSTGCIMQTAAGDMVQVPWSRISNSLTNVFQTYFVQPRLGVLFLHGNSANPAVDTNKVYIGDYNSSGVAGTPLYDNLITAVNSIAPVNGTPTGPAMWDVFNYFKQASPQYGGFSVQSSSSDTTNEWKNPLYECNSSGANCLLTSCAKNFVILMTDGEWNTPSCSISDGVSDPVQPAYQMHMGFTNAPTGVSTNVSAFYTLGLFLDANGTDAVENVAMYGSFNTSGFTWPGNTSGYPETSCSLASGVGCSTGKGSLCTALPADSTDWDTTGEGLPDTYYNISTGASEIYNAILGAVLDALKRASSGTAASVLTKSQGSGAILSQAVFYPVRQFGLNEINWTSELQTLWYYLDPTLQSPAILDNTGFNSNGKDQLNLSTDYALQFQFNTTTLQTTAAEYNYSNLTSPVGSVTIDNINALWKAGLKLWSTNATGRTIYTTTDFHTLTSFTGLDPTNAANQSLLQASSAAQATSIINYIEGIDQSGYRSRTVTIGSGTAVWKLGDIVDSTPQIEAASGLNQYNLQSPQGYGDVSYGQFINSLNYQTRNMVYASANDGMLHAFELGTLDTSAATGNTGSIKATLCNDTAGKGNCSGETSSTSNLGSEQWAFIPNNALPYLTYLANPNYCHLYYVDGPLYVFDASINMLADCTASSYSGCSKQTTLNSNNNVTSNETSWRTVLIGSMGMGGACRNYNTACNGGTTNCVNTPVSNAGFSSYFALDVTSPGSPSLMWEMPNPNANPADPTLGKLGFSMSGPAVVRISYQNGNVPDNTKNGYWFAVFASGPTGPITSTQFMGRSDQDIMLFIVDLKTGSLLRTIDTGIPNAFATSVFNAPIDTDRGNTSSTGFYQDNVFYVGYVKQCPSSNTSCTDTTWTNGGVLRVITNEDPNPGNWVFSKVIDDIGPVTTSVAKLQDINNGNLWLYFGTGRFFFKTSTSIDDANGQRAIYGIKEPCYNSITNTINNSCTSSVSSSALTDRTTDNSTAAAPANGWFINLAATSGTSLAERVITDPLAAPNGVVYFTTFSPNSDLCAFGGNTYLWAVGYNTGTSGIDITPVGGTATQTKAVSSVVQGQAMMQVSTGSIAQVNLANTFASSRKSAAITGQAPEGQGLSVVINPQPIKKILHIRER